MCRWGGLVVLKYYSLLSSLSSLLLLPSLFFLLLALVLLVLLFLLVLLLLHCLCLGSRRFRLPSFACSLLSSPIVFSPLANRCPSSPEVFFALLAPTLFLFPPRVPARRIREPSATELHNLVCSNPSLKGPGMRRR